VPLRTLHECVDLIARGELTSERLVADCLAAIDATESEIQAWASVDRERALADAKKMDDLRRSGFALGDLHGIPVGIKDNIDTADYLTCHGSSIYAANQPARDAAVIEKLREAGAVILGKTVCTEFAYMHPACTRNPHNSEYSPGGSSSGSAAAVSAGHVPLALGTQTNGSVIRPASFCGCYGFKPSAGVVPRRGVFQTSDTLDQLGVFALNAEDLALAADAIKGFDATDSHSQNFPRPRLRQGYLAEVPVPPNFAWIELPYADEFSSSMREGCAELVSELDAQVDKIPAPQTFKALLECHKRIYDYEIFRCLQHEREQHADELSDTVKAALERASEVSQADYTEALSIRTAAMDWFAEFFNDYDAVLTASALGEPPLFGESTGNPICCTIWTLCGLPAVSLPLLQGEAELPLGVQLVGAYNQDDRLMRTTRWLLDSLNQ